MSPKKNVLDSGYDPLSFPLLHNPYQGQGIRVFGYWYGAAADIGLAILLDMGLLLWVGIGNSLGLYMGITWGIGIGLIRLRNKIPLSFPTILNEKKNIM